MTEDLDFGMFLDTDSEAFKKIKREADEFGAYFAHFKSFRDFRKLCRDNGVNYRAAQKSFKRRSLEFFKIKRENANLIALMSGGLWVPFDYKNCFLWYYPEHSYRISIYLRKDGKSVRIF